MHKSERNRLSKVTGTYFFAEAYDSGNSSMLVNLGTSDDNDERKAVPPHLSHLCYNRQAYSKI
jgi:hypothetical protein